MQHLQHKLKAKLEWVNGLTGFFEMFPILSQKSWVETFLIQ